MPGETADRNETFNNIGIGGRFSVLSPIDGLRGYQLPEEGLGNPKLLDGSFSVSPDEELEHIYGFELPGLVRSSSSPHIAYQLPSTTPVKRVGR